MNGRTAWANSPGTRRKSSGSSGRHSCNWSFRSCAQSRVALKEQPHHCAVTKCWRWPARVGSSTARRESPVAPASGGALSNEPRLAPLRSSAVPESAPSSGGLGARMHASREGLDGIAGPNKRAAFRARFLPPCMGFRRVEWQERARVGSRRVQESVPRCLTRQRGVFHANGEMFVPVRTGPRIADSGSFFVSG